jgi:transitional endoplasmic reticulum ATPase
VSGCGLTCISLSYSPSISVSTLVILAGYEDGDDRPSFATAVKQQISALRKQLSGGPAEEVRDTAVNVPGAWNGTVPHPSELIQRPNVDSHINAQQDRIWQVDSRFNMRLALGRGDMSASMTGGPEQDMKDGRDMRSRALAAAALGRSYLF